MAETPLSLLRRRKLPQMVHWYKPALLAQIGVRTIVSATFGQYADQRLLQAATDGASEHGLVTRYDFSDPVGGPPSRRLALEPDGALWVDYAADVGDGFECTYPTAYNLAQPALEVPGAGRLPAGQILILGGDQAYPAATREAYRDRLIVPYRWAFPASEAQRKLFAIPGNHDWYDGLSAFDSLFCASRADDSKGTRIGGWQTMQHRSYWAIRLPYNWWIWGADIQFSKYLDEAQVRYFETIAEGMGSGHKVILCLAEPNWLVAEREYDQFGNLNVITRIAMERGAHVCAVIAGDWHHYNHYTSEQIDTHFIVAGGGGAFTHATHDLRTDVDISWPTRRPIAPKGGAAKPPPGLALMTTLQEQVAEEEGGEWVPRRIRISLKAAPKAPPQPTASHLVDLGAAGEQARAAAEEAARGVQQTVLKLAGKPRCYPDRWASAGLSLRNLAFPVLNWEFAAGIGLIYWIMTWLFHIVVTDVRVGGQEFDRIGHGKGFAGLLEHLGRVPAYIIEAMSYSIGLSLMLACLLIGLIWYVQVEETRNVARRYLRKLVVGSLHFVAHLTAMMVLLVLLVRWHIYIAPTLQAAVDAFWQTVAVSAPDTRARLEGPIKPIAEGRGWVVHFLAFIFPLEMMVLGGLVGGFIWGLYWVLASILAGMHCADAFAALRITGYRNFLRMRFEPDRVTIYPIGLDKVPSRRAWRQPTASESAADVTARLHPTAPMPLKLIEDPIVIRSPFSREP